MCAKFKNHIRFGIQKYVTIYQVLKTSHRIQS